MVYLLFESKLVQYRVTLLAFSVKMVNLMVSLVKCNIPEWAVSVIVCFQQG